MKMNWTPTQVWIFLQQLVLAIIALAVEIAADPAALNLFPQKYAHAIAAIALIAMKFRGMKNLQINPNGTSAVLPYEPKGKD